MRIGAPGAGADGARDRTQAQYRCQCATNRRIGGRAAYRGWFAGNAAKPQRFLRPPHGFIQKGVDVHMKVFLRLLSFLRPFWRQVVLAILLGCIMIASNVGLLGMAAYLIAAAALGPLLVMLMLPIYIVRFAGVSRAVSRYAERLVAHHVTFRLFAIFSHVLAWVALVFLVAAGLGVPLLTGMLARGWGKRQLAARAELNAQIVDGIQGVQDLLAYGRAGDQQEKIAALDRVLGQVQRRMARITGLRQMLNDFLMNLALWTILILAIPLIATKAINGVYLAFLTLVILASFEAVQPLAQAFQFLGHSVAAGERLFEVTDATPQVVECAAPLSTPTRHLPAGYTLEFDHVQFAYHTDEGEVLGGISLSICPGKRVAIVGPSGSGKSTIIRLALRFWDPTRGTIRLDGQDIRRYRLSDLRNLIGVVAQDTYLFNDTMRSNLLLARPGASDDEIKQVLEQAQLTEFIDQLPDGLETWIGEQRLRLSCGERQRLAIARVLLKNAPLLILDEATANLDPLTEQPVLNALNPLIPGRTTLVITHRLVAMERMDEILVLDHGRIIERGTHDQLLIENGLYQQMFDVQNGMLVLP